MSFMREEGGFTLIETVIAVAIIGVITLAMIGSFRSTTRIQQFRGDVQDFAKQLQETQVSSYTVKTNSSIPNRQYWRGTSFEVNDTNDRIAINLLTGGDLLLQNSNQRRGITQKHLDETFLIRDRYRMDLSALCYEVGGVSLSATQVTAAFLAPDGASYIKNTIFSSFSAPGLLEPYDTKGTLKFVFDSLDTELEAIVTFESMSGTIDIDIGTFTGC